MQAAVRIFAIAARRRSKALAKYMENEFAAVAAARCNARRARSEVRH
jgi:hypothetical protein